MADDLSDLPELRMLEPPPGGLERLRERLGDLASNRRSRGWLAVPIGALAAAIAIWFAIGSSSQPPESPVAVRGALPDPAIAPNFYWVTSRPAGPDVVVPAPAQISIDEAPGVVYRAP